MRYLILIYNNPQSRQIWERLPEDARAAGYQAYADLDDELTGSGELIVSEALADASTATRVTVRDGQTIASDGPFAEVKEQLAGFYLVECETVARAVEIAARVPGSEYLELEVRPVLSLGGSEM